MEQENKYGSKAVGGTALGLSIGAVAAELLGGNLGNIFGGNRGGESAPVSHTEARLMAENAELKTEVKFRDSTIYTDNKIDSKMLELFKYFEGKFACVEGQLSEQRVYNATNTAAISCIQGQVAQLAALTKVIIPIGNVCPQPMPQYNSWVAPTTPTGTTGA